MKGIITKKAERPIQRLPLTVSAELQAISVCAAALSPLADDERARILRYLDSRFMPPGETYD